MRSSKLLILLPLLSCCLAVAATSVVGEETDDLDSQVLAAIKESDSAEKLRSCLDDLKKNGANQQQVLETEIMWCLVHPTEVAFSKTIIPEIEAAINGWDTEKGLFLKKPSQVEAAKHYISAYQANLQGDSATAKSEILAAIWLDPKSQLTDFYVKAIPQLQPPPNVTIPMDLKIRTADDTETTLESFVHGYKALYIQIWATWCGPCRVLFPKLSYRAKMLPTQGIQVVALNSELGRNKRLGGDAKKAKFLQEKKEMTLPWLVEPSKAPYTSLLDIDSVPRAILVDPTGHVLFNGHPMDTGLIAALDKLSVKLNFADEPPEDEKP